MVRTTHRPSGFFHNVSVFLRLRVGSVAKALSPNTTLTIPNTTLTVECSGRQDTLYYKCQKVCVLPPRGCHTADWVSSGKHLLAYTSGVWESVIKALAVPCCAQRLRQVFLSHCLGLVGATRAAVLTLWDYDPFDKPPSPKYLHYIS